CVVCWRRMTLVRGQDAPPAPPWNSGAGTDPSIAFASITSRRSARGKPARGSLCGRAASRPQWSRHWSWPTASSPVLPDTAGKCEACRHRTARLVWEDPVSAPREGFMDVSLKEQERSVRTLIVSDVHLGFRFAQAEHFLTYLKGIRPEQLFILGDFLDG